MEGIKKNFVQQLGIKYYLSYG